MSQERKHRFQIYLIIICPLLLLCCASHASITHYLAARAAEAAERYDEAAQQYETSIQSESLTSSYATARLALCRYQLGDKKAAKKIRTKLIRSAPNAPWTQMLQIEWGNLLYKEKDYEKALQSYNAVLTDPWQPWWMERHAWKRIKTMLEIPKQHPAAFSWLREQAENAPYIGPRRDAARLLLQSENAEDHFYAVLGLLRSGAYDEARKALMRALPHFASPHPTQPTLAELTQLLDTSPKEESNATWSTLVTQHAGSPWMQLWLIYAMRQQAQKGHFANSERLCDLLVREYRQTREAGEGLWWLARYLQREQRDTQALSLYEKLLRECPEHYRADDAQFEIALAHYHAKETNKAETAFLQLCNTFPDSSLRSQAYYTCAQMAQHDDESKAPLARLYYACAMQSGLGDYYAHRATARLHRLSHPDAPPTPLSTLWNHSDGLQPISTTPPASPYAQPLAPDTIDTPALQRLFLFGEHGLEEGEWEARSLCSQVQPGDTKTYHALAQAGYMHTARQHIQHTATSPAEPEKNYIDYPLAYWPLVQKVAREIDIDPYLLLAVARQESTFRAAVRSSAGATGVMQLMPATAQWLAKITSELTAKQAQELTHPLHSLYLGAHYLSRMLKRSDNNLVYALASYNGGPGNCDKWRKRFPTDDMDQFIEAIPFNETRNYVKKVLANYAAYHSLYK